ncbi:MAG TPA: ABC transporter ATP-binding protein, partial [Polyangiales bacterium]
MLRRLLGLAWALRYRCLALMSCQITLLGLGVIALSASGLAIDRVQAALLQRTPRPTRFLSDLPPFQTLCALAGVIGAIAIVRAFLNFAYSIGVADLVQMRIVPDIRARVYEKLHTLNFRFFDEQSSGSLLNRITGDVQSLRSFIDGVLIQSAVVALALAVNLTYMLSKHVGLTLVCTATSPVMVILTTRFSRRVQPAYAENRAEVDDLVLDVSEAMRGIHVIKSFAAEQTVLAKFAAQNAAVRDGQQRIFEQVSRFTPSVDLLSHFNVIGLLCYGGLLVARGRLSVGDLVVFATLVQQLSTQVTTMSTVINTLQESLIGAARVFEVLDAETPIRDPIAPRALPKGALSLRFEAVSFEHEQHAILTTIDLEVQPGECVALFGPPGAGKSTLLSLVPRFHDVS